MIPIPEVNACLQELDRVNNKCTDFLFAHWKEKDEFDKQILWIKYLKYDKERTNFISRLNQLCKPNSN